MRCNPVSPPCKRHTRVGLVCSSRGSPGVLPTRVLSPQPCALIVLPLKPAQMGGVSRLSAYLSAKLLRNNRTEAACFPVTIVGINYGKQRTTVLIPYYDKAGQKQCKEAEVDSCCVHARAPPADRLDLRMQEHADQLPVIKLPRSAAVRQIYPLVRQPKTARAQPAGSAAWSNRGASVRLHASSCYMPVDSACACAACASRADKSDRLGPCLS